MYIENICIYNMYRAVLGIRNSRKSKDKSDSEQKDVQKWLENLTTNNEKIIWSSYNHCLIGQEDERLIKTLLKNPAERKFLRQIFVAMDVSMSIKGWAQLDTYKVGTVRDSESTMYCVVKGNIDPGDFERKISSTALDGVNQLIEFYNLIRNEYFLDTHKVEWDIEGKKEFGIWIKDIPIVVSGKTTEELETEVFELIDANLPAGYVLESHWTANYEVLRNIYYSRENHKMYWWHEFCNYIEKLPYFDLLIGGK
jgi:hypothetical protein